MSPSNQAVRAAIAEQADAWFVENRSGPLGAEARAAFTAWLRASPVHVQEYIAIAVLARDLPAATNPPHGSIESLLAEMRADTDKVTDFAPAPRASARPRVRWPSTGRWVTAGAMLLVIGAAIWVASDGDRFGLPRTYSTTHGEQSVRRLPDGSTLHLNTDSELTVRYSRGERLVELERGEALFDVAHDGRRPFRVVAGTAGVLAVGTQFDVYRTPAAVQVTVVEGMVSVFATSAPQAAQQVAAGYQVEVGERVGRPRPVDAHAAVFWLERKIAFEDRPLGEVAEEFNRYGRITIVIEDPELRSLPISGLFDAYDTDSFAAFLGTLAGVQVTTTPTRLVIRKLAPAIRGPVPLAR